ncbi:MAG: hypothetical protein FJ267_06635, partial [Planctomycetes bacterium]|nr:hypothetical protein [Planctomycetota bacterium]
MKDGENEMKSEVALDNHSATPEAHQNLPDSVATQPVSDEPSSSPSSSAPPSSLLPSMSSSPSNANDVAETQHEVDSEESETYAISPINVSTVTAMNTNDDDMKVIRENQKRIEERERERRIELRNEIYSNASRDDAIMAATKTILIGALFPLSVFFSASASKGA